MDQYLVKILFTYSNDDSRETFAVVDSKNLNKISNFFATGRESKDQLLEYQPARLTEADKIYIVSPEGDPHGVYAYARLIDILNCTIIIKNVIIDHNGLTHK